MHWWAIVGLILLFAVRLDVWWWNDATLVGGLPIGLAYHVLFCFVVSGFMWLLVRTNWPTDVEAIAPQVPLEGLVEDGSGEAS